MKPTLKILRHRFQRLYSRKLQIQLTIKTKISTSLNYLNLIIVITQENYI